MLGAQPVLTFDATSFRQLSKALLVEAAQLGMAFQIIAGDHFDLRSISAASPYLTSLGAYGQPGAITGPDEIASMSSLERLVAFADHEEVDLSRLEHLVAARAAGQGFRSVVSAPNIRLARISLKKWDDALTFSASLTGLDI